MNQHMKPVTDEELHAYVDAELKPQRHLEVEAWLAAHPDAAQRVRDYRSLEQQLHARYDKVLNEPAELPEQLRRGGYTMALRAAALAGVMLLSGALGWQFERMSGSRAPSLAMSDLVQPAAFAHLVYASDTRRPVEIPAAQRALLDNWVSQRLHTTLQAPDLSGKQFEFIGGRLLPSTNRMAAQFMYQDPQARRLTVYVRRLADQEGLRDFQYQEQDGLHIFYWLDDAMGYAVIGPQDASQLIEVANAVHAAFR